MVLHMHGASRDVHASPHKSFCHEFHTRDHELVLHVYTRVHLRMHASDQRDLRHAEVFALCA